MKGYLITVEAKLLQPVNKTFYSIPTDDANGCFLDRLTSGASIVMPLPPPGRQQGVRHGTETPSLAFRTLIGSFQ